MVAIAEPSRPTRRALAPPCVGSGTCARDKTPDPGTDRNQQYSITALTDGGGAIVERYAYTAYGLVTFADASGTVQATSASNNRYAFTGREWDEGLSLYHYRARMHDAAAGRFVSRDPIGFEGSPWNLYEYVRSKTLTSVDPTGMEPGGMDSWAYCHGKLYDPTDQGCCVGSIYSLKDQKCVNGRVVSRACAGVAAGACSTCTLADCESDMQTIKDRTKNTKVPFVDWEYTKKQWTLDQCDRWVQKVRIPKLKCVESSNQIRWSYYFVGGHVAIKVTFCDGTVMYIDNGWAGGNNGIFWPEDTGFPYTNPVEGAH